MNDQNQLQYDDTEKDARHHIGKHMDQKWFNSFFQFLKQEPREGVPDRFRMASSMLLQFAFDLIRTGTAAASFEDIQQEVEVLYGDGSDKHQHRATAEVLGALVCSYRDSSAEYRDKMWAFVFPIIRGIFQDGLTPDNSSYWSSFLHLILVCLPRDACGQPPNFFAERERPAPVVANCGMAGSVPA